jgi:hypothetical protein
MISENRVEPHHQDTTDSPGSMPSVHHEEQYAVDQVFDYASFMWDTADIWQQQQHTSLEEHVALGIIPHQETMV